MSREIPPVPTPDEFGELRAKLNQDVIRYHLERCEAMLRRMATFYSIDAANYVTKALYCLERGK